METSELDVVTGAFSYTGKYIARRLLHAGRHVRTLTGHPDRPNPFGQRVSVAPLNFSNPKKLRESLRGAATLYNTYWVRFSHGRVAFSQAIENTKILFQAAREAGVRRVVHVSITNPAENSPLPYFRGKAVLERALCESGMSYAILRPTVIFGTEDILVNNIAWFLRHSPVFGIPGRGDYRLQPIFVEDMADIAIRAAAAKEDLTMDAVGPEIFTFEELVRLIAGCIGSKTKIVHLNPGLVLFCCRLAGYFVRDVVLTREEIEGLMAGLLVSTQPATGKTRLTDWLARNAARVGKTYASELDRHFPRA